MLSAKKVINIILDKLSSKGKNELVMSKTSRIDVSKELGRIASSRAWINSLSSSDTQIRTLVKRPEMLPKTIKEIRIAGVFDLFTESCLGDVCKVKNLSINDFKKEVIDFGPHFLFIESAWRGKDEGWNKKVSNPSAEMLELTSFCRTRSIPIAFWNKEDPVHFKEFLGTARMCDYVFTTDMDSISNYMAELRHGNVYLLPFAAAPGIHNPIEKFDRKGKFSFAGSYYAQYGGRKEEFDLLIDVCASTVGIDIFDRNYKTSNARYQFPEKYQQYILGTLPYDEIDRAYKGYKFGVNVNSVKNSQTMFARRVFEQMACNCLTITGYSRAIRNFFGDIIPCSSDPRLLTEKIEELVNDPTEYRKLRLLGLRTVLANHLYVHRLERIVEKLFDKKIESPFPTVLVISDPVGEEQIRRVLAHYNKQKTINKKLLLLLEDENDIQISDRSIGIIKRREFEEMMLRDVCNAQFVSYFSPQDYYGANYLTDLLLTRQYSDAKVIGKSSSYRYANGSFELVDNGKQYKNAESLMGSSSLISVELVDDATLGQFINLIHEDAISFEKMFSIDEMNYCRGWGGETCPKVDDMVLLDYGRPISEIYRLSDNISINDQAGGLGGKVIDDFTGLLEKVDSLNVQASQHGKGISISTTLPADKWVYVRFKNPLPIEQITQDNNIAASINIEATGKINFFLALVCLDENKNKLGSLFVKQGITLNDKIPQGTKMIWPWIRVSNSGNCILRSLSFASAKKKIDVWLTKTTNLLITNGYPSYDDLYQKVFVHKRVLGYQQENIPVDVFCFHPTKEEGYREFEGIPVVTGSNDLLNCVLDARVHNQVLVHFLTPELWKVLNKYLDRLKIIIWVHGAEIQPWFRREFNFRTAEELNRAKEISESRMKFWKKVFELNHPNVHFVFVSRQFYEEATSDIGVKLDDAKYSIIHNFVDTALFSYSPKVADARLKILSIRPFASAAYANDLSAKAIVELSTKDFFRNMEFRIIGDGEQFEEITEPLKAYPNVVLEKRFLHQDEIASLHKHYGVFLVPSRIDTQGVSRDEAMSSGLVPVTNRVAAIPEFVDDSCAILADAEDYLGLANGIERLYNDPDLFLRMSQAAAERVRNQSSKTYTINREIELIRSTSVPSGEKGSKKLEQEVNRDSELLAE